MPNPDDDLTEPEQGSSVPEKMTTKNPRDITQYPAGTYFRFTTSDNHFNGTLLSISRYSVNNELYVRIAPDKSSKLQCYKIDCLLPWEVIARPSIPNGTREHILRYTEVSASKHVYLVDLSTGQVTLQIPAGTRVCSELIVPPTHIKFIKASVAASPAQQADKRAQVNQTAYDKNILALNHQAERSRHNSSSAAAAAPTSTHQDDLAARVQYLEAELQRLRNAQQEPKAAAAVANADEIDSRVNFLLTGIVSQQVEIQKAQNAISDLIYKIKQACQISATYRKDLRKLSGEVIASGRDLSLYGLSETLDAYRSNRETVVANNEILREAHDSMHRNIMRAFGLQPQPQPQPQPLQYLRQPKRLREMPPAPLTGLYFSGTLPSSSSSSSATSYVAAEPKQQPEEPGSTTLPGLTYYKPT